MEEEDPLGQTRILVVTGVGSEAERTFAALHLHPLSDTRVTEMVSTARDSLRYQQADSTENVQRYILLLQTHSEWQPLAVTCSSL
jgi:predicted Zn-dependent protease